MRRAVPLYQGPGANIWGSGLFRASTTGGYPPVTAAATTTPSGHAPNVLGDPPPQGDDKPGTYAGGDKGEHLEVVRTTGWRTGELRVNDQVYTTGSPRTALAAAPAAPGGRTPPVPPQQGDELAGDSEWTSLGKVVRAPGVLEGIDRGQDSTGNRRAVAATAAPGGHAPPVTLLQQGEDPAGDPRQVE